MAFKGEKMAWSCPQSDCAMIAHPKRDATKGNPIIGKAPVELIRTSDGHVLLHARDEHVLIDVTEYMTAQGVKLIEGKYAVLLKLNEAVFADGFDNRPL
jgi:hypothetical protein